MRQREHYQGEALDAAMMLARLDESIESIEDAIKHNFGAEIDAEQVAADAVIAVQAERGE